MADAAIGAQIAAVRARLALYSGDPSPPSPPSKETIVALPFTFASAPSIILGTMPVGATVSETAVFIETVFDTPATLRLGSSADLSMLFAASDSRLDRVGQYQSDALVIAPTTDVLVLSLNLAGASVGSGLLFFRMLLP